MIAWKRLFVALSLVCVFPLAAFATPQTITLQFSGLQGAWLVIESNPPIPGVTTGTFAP